MILDIVYNHTAEGTTPGRRCRFGVSIATYYRLADNPRIYVDDTRYDDTIDISHAPVLQLVAEFVRYWVEQMHVNGSRFDLATTLRQEASGSTPTAASSMPSDRIGCSAG